MKESLQLLLSLIKLEVAGSKNGMPLWKKRKEKKKVPLIIISRDGRSHMGRCKFIHSRKLLMLGYCDRPRQLTVAGRKKYRTIIIPARIPKLKEYIRVEQ